jgi:hypothetical protein
MNKIMTDDVLQRYAKAIKKDVYGLQRTALRWTVFFLLLALTAGLAALVYWWHSQVLIIEIIFVEVGLVAAVIKCFLDYKSWGKFIRKNFDLQKEEVVNEEYRKGVNEGIEEARWTLGKILPYFLLFIVFVLVLGWILQATGIISMNIQREVTQHSQGYTESKARLLQKLHTDYLQLETEIAELQNKDDSQQIILMKRAQQKENLNRMRGEADLLPQSEVPQSVKTFLAKHQ